MALEDTIKFALANPQWALDQLDKADCEESLLAFTRRHWHTLEPNTEFVDGWALEAICEHLEGVTYGHINRLLMNVPPGFMKLCADSTPILTPDGRRTHGDLNVGDRVFGPDGKPTKVLRISPKALADYEVTFSTHETIKCNGDHLWTVYDRFAKKWKTIDTRTMADARTEIDRNRFFIPDTAPLQFPERELPIHPYFLGCWLGDGTSKKPYITHDKDDLNHIEKLEALGYLVTKRYYQGRVVHSVFAHQGIIQIIREMGIYGNKGIPQSYLMASEEQRCELLAGLIDTDGTVDQSRGRVSITTTEPKFAQEILHLILSLGMRPYMTVFDAPGYGEYRSKKRTHLITFQPIRPLPTAVPRKEVDGRTFALRRRAIVRVEKAIEPELGHCITVDRKDGLYVVGRTNVVTHNSLMTNVFWPAWMWGPKRQAHKRFLAFSYAASLTNRDNGKFRDLLISQDYKRLWGDRFNLRKVGEEKISNDKMGWKLASSVGGVGTGERADIVALDDPHNIKESESDVVRSETVRWFREGMSNRLNDMEKSAIVVIMQRVHESDVSGSIIESAQDYTHLMIPMEYDGRRYYTSIDWTDPRDDDGALAWPERFSPKVVKGLKDILGPFGFAGQYQQAPTPRGGGIFKREWWQLWGNPDDPADPHFKKFPACDYIVASLDSAYTEKTENDYSALTVWGSYRDRNDMPKAILMNAWRDRLAIHELVNKVSATCKKFKVDRLLIESKASGISVGQEIRRLHSNEGFGVQLIDPKGGDKVARAYACQAFFSDEMIYAPDRDWSDMVITEMASFPRAPHDDLVDSSTQALKHFRDAGLLIHGAEMAADLGEQLAHRPNNKSLYPV